MKNIYFIIAVVVVIALGGYFFMSQKPAAKIENVQSSLSTQEPSVPVEQTPNQIVTLDAGVYYYSVKEIKAKVGDVIKVVMTAKDMMHNFNIDELNIKSSTVKAGETTEFTFTAGKAGTFEYYCSIGSHRANGQTGKLIVL